MSENGLLSLTKAARHFGLNRHSLADAAKRGLVRSRRIEAPGLGRNGVGFLFDVDELQEDLERLPTCRYDGCDRPALGSSGGCEAHGHVFAGARAQGVKRPDIGPAISAAKTGKPRPDWSERLRQLHREQGHSPPEERSCERCGRYIGLVYVSQGRRFCTPSCVTLWRWKNEPESFNLRHGGQGGPEFLCAICRHRTVVRWPSQVAAAGGEQKARFICSTCDPLWRSAVMRARGVLGMAVDKGHVNPRAASFANGAQEPFRSAAAVAKTFAEAVRAAAQDKRGRRPPAAADLLIEAAHREGFTDRLVADALNWLLDEGELVIPGLANGHVFDVKYVETRRDRAGIRRGARAA